MDRVTNDAGVGAYQPTIETIGSQHFDDDGSLIAVPPAFLFMAGPAELASKETTQTHYDYRLAFTVFCLQSNLRGSHEERRGDDSDPGVYDMLEDLKRLFAGARLPVAGAASNPLVSLTGHRPEGGSPEGFLASLTVSVESEFH